VVVKGVVTKREKYEVAPPLVVGDEGLRMIMTTDRMFWRLATYACRCAVRAASGLESTSMERLSSSSWRIAIPCAAVICCFRRRAMVFSFSEARAAACSRARASYRVLRATTMATMRASCSRCAIAVVA
jgi:hypothetical protein